MNFYKVGRLLPVFLMPFLIASAQYTNDDGGLETQSGYLRYFEIGGSAVYQNLYDEAISPILYQKIWPGAYIGNLKVSESTHSEVSIYGSSLKINNKTNELLKTTVKAQRATIDYRFLMKLPVTLGGRRNEIDVKGGAFLSGMFTYKNAPHLVDASVVYEYAASFGLCVRLSKEIYLWDKTGFISWDVSMPFVANVSRPGYFNIENDADPEYKRLKSVFDNATTGSFGKHFRLNSRVSYMYRLENGNMLRFGYQWDYSRTRTINSVYLAEHALFLIFMFQY